MKEQIILSIVTWLDSALLMITAEEAKSFFQGLTLFTTVGAALYGILTGIRDFRRKKARERMAHQKSFENLVEQLTSPNKSAQLAAAILLRRYFNLTKHSYEIDLRLETINVISSMLKILPVGVFQKTLADGLGYATDLSKCDLQKTNLQDVLLDNKNQDIAMNKTDLFLADLSYANLEGITGHGIVLYNAILFCARIRNCDFTDANMRGADLTGVVFKKCTLYGADFTGAKNIPPFIKENLDKDNKFKVEGKIDAMHETKDKCIFFSMPGVMSKEEELTTRIYQEYLVKEGYEVIYYRRDEYPRFGQLNRVKESVKKSCGMIAFGFKQVHIPEASYRPGTRDESLWKEKWLSTPWNGIEVGMGLTEGMPILLVHDPIIQDGVFDDGLSECFIAKISTMEDSRRLEYNKSFQSWMSKL